MNRVIITLTPGSLGSSCHFNMFCPIFSPRWQVSVLWEEWLATSEPSSVPPTSRAISKHIVCFEQTFCSGSIWLTRIIKHLNKNHCLLPLESVQLVTDSLEGWQKARCIVLGDIQASMEGPVCHLPPPLLLRSQSNHFNLIRARFL